MAQRKASYSALSLVVWQLVDAPAAISAETAMLLHDVNKDDVNTDPFTSDEKFRDDETIVDDE